MDWSHTEETRYQHNKAGSDMEHPGKQKSRKAHNYMEKGNYSSVQSQGINTQVKNKSKNRKD